MKKLLIATAALAMVAGTAQAQSSVTVYGSIDTGYSSVETTVGSTGVKTTNVGIAQSSDVTSRWGMRGSEDLGGGMKANFNVETGIGSGSNGALNSNTTAAGAWDNATVLGNRAMWASISTAGGLEIRGGLQNQFIRDAALNNADGTTNVVGNTLAGNSSVFANRHNAISVTQTMGAVRVGAAMTGKSQEVSNTTLDIDSAKGYELMARYEQGPLRIDVAYRKVETSVAAVSTVAATGIYAGAVPISATNPGVQYVAAAAATNTETETTVISASYDFGPVKAFVGYGTNDTKEQIGGAITEREMMTIGINGNLNAKTQLFATYSTGETKASATAAALDVDGYVAGVRYSLSKRTTAYAIYGTRDTNTSATAVTKDKQYAFGLNHAF
jgi:predicted porin